MLIKDLIAALQKALENCHPMAEVKIQGADEPDIKFGIKEVVTDMSPAYVNIICSADINGTIHKALELESENEDLKNELEDLKDRLDEIKNMADR